MAIHHRISTDQDFEEVLENQVRVRVFQDNQIVDSSAVVVRFDDQVVVTQAGVGDISYHSRSDCEFFRLKKR